MLQNKAGCDIIKLVFFIAWRVDPSRAGRRTTNTKHKGGMKHDPMENC